MKGTVLVTGATGFVGRYLVRHLAGDGWRVIAAARGTDGIVAGPGVTALALPDLGKRVHWSPLLAGVTHAVHLAGIAHAARDIPEAQYMAVNAEAAGSLAAAARAKGLKRLVMMSSIRAATGPVSAMPVRESDAPVPTDAYGRSKLEGERRVREALAGSATEFVILRPVLVYGPGVKGNMRLLMHLARSPWPMPFGSLRGRRSLLSLGNLASAVSHALTEPRCAGETFLVADKEPMMVAEILRDLRCGLGRKPWVFTVPLAPAALLVNIAGRQQAWQRLTGDLVADTRALRATGWVPPEAARDALAAAIATDG